MEHDTRLTPDTIVSWHPAQASAEIDGDVVVMGFTQGKYVGLNDIASAVWRRLERPQPVAALCDGMIRDFDGDADEIRRDILALLAELHEFGLLQTSAPGDA
jgi:hypothetical protein